MPENTDPAEKTFRVIVNGEVVERKGRRVSASEIRRQRSLERSRELAEESAKAPRQSNTGEIVPGPETVDVAEVRKEVKKREKAEGT